MRAWPIGDLIVDSPEPAAYATFYHPPAWPDTSSAKRYHVDVYVDDLDTAEQQCVAAGGRVLDFQPGEGRWRVLLDPAGHRSASANDRRADPGGRPAAAARGGSARGGRRAPAYRSGPRATAAHIAAGSPAGTNSSHQVAPAAATSRR